MAIVVGFYVTLKEFNFKGFRWINAHWITRVQTKMIRRRRLSSELIEVYIISYYILYKLFLKIESPILISVSILSWLFWIYYRVCFLSPAVKRTSRFYYNSVRYVKWGYRKNGVLFLFYIPFYRLKVRWEIFDRLKCVQNLFVKTNIVVEPCNSFCFLYASLWNSIL